MEFVVTLFIMIILAFTGYIVPFLLKGHILFGSRFPNEIIKHPNVKNLKKNFTHLYLTIYIPFLIIFCLFLFNSTDNLFNVIGIFAEIFLLLVIYAIYNKKAKELKIELMSSINVPLQKKILTIDTKFREEKYHISIWWFVPSLLIIVTNIFMLTLYYERIPDQIILHYDLKGIAYQLTDKSYPHVFMMPLISVFNFFLFILIYFSIKTARQELDSNLPETSKFQDRYFRLIWSNYSVILCTAIVTWIFFLSFHLNRLLPIPANIFQAFNILLPILILLSALILAIKTGQSGSKLKFAINESETGLNNIDDDSYWKFGMIYYNPNDPSIFIPKRMGIGWTINFGRPIGIVILILVFVFQIIISFISKS